MFHLALDYKQCTNEPNDSLRIKHVQVTMDNFQALKFNPTTTPFTENLPHAPGPKPHT